MKDEQLELSFEEINSEIVRTTKIRKPKSNSKVKGDEYRLLELKRILNTKPNSKLLKTNQYYGNKYIPIEILERMLGAIFNSYQFIMRIPPIVEQGNIIFFIDVVVINPVTMEKEVYTGVSATPIMPKNGTITDIHPHIPAAKSFAIMNGCKHIGRLFRAENDVCTDIFNTYFEDKIAVKEENPLEKRINKMIESCNSVNELKSKVGESYTKFASTKENYATTLELLTAFIK